MSVVDGYDRYQPSVEVSRGCGMGCAFCAEAALRLSPLKDPAVVASEFERLISLYRSENVHPYLECSFFRPTTDWCHRFAVHYSGLSMPLQWRTETRVDSLTTAQIQLLGKAGLKVLDIGLESASHRQLLSMRKTPNPSAYLARASHLLEVLADAGVWAKVNILLYPGETFESIEETSAWIDARRELVKGVSVYPLVMYRAPGWESYSQTIEALGATLVDRDGVDLRGFSHVHLSAQLDSEAATFASTSLSQRFMTERDYFDLKSFSYFPRSFSWRDFGSMVAREEDRSILPFSVQRELVGA